MCASAIFSLDRGFSQQAVNAVEDGDRDVLVDRLLPEQHHAPVLRHEGDARARAPPRLTGSRTGLPSSFRLPRRSGSLPNRARASSICPRAHEAVDAGDLAGPQVDREIAQAAAVAHALDREHDGLGVIAA